MAAIGNPRYALELARDLIGQATTWRPTPTISPATALVEIDRALRGQPYPAASLETAACIWEAVLEMERDGDARSADPVAEKRGAMIRAAREAMGSSALRSTALGWVDAIDAAWRDTDTGGGVHPEGGHYDRTFDWDFVPGWIADHVDWSNEHCPTIRKRSPLSDLDTGLRAWLVEEMGMRAEIMGGGAYGLQHDGPGGSYILVTCVDGGGFPTPDNWHVGAYLPGDADALLNLTSEHEGRAGATLEMAVAACCGVLADYEPRIPVMAPGDEIVMAPAPVANRFAVRFGRGDEYGIILPGRFDDYDNAQTAADATVAAAAPGSWACVQEMNPDDTPVSDENDSDESTPAQIIADALVLLDSVAGAEMHSAETGAFSLHDGRHYTFRTH